MLLKLFQSLSFVLMSKYRPFGSISDAGGFVSVFMGREYF